MLTDKEHLFQTYLAFTEDQEIRVRKSVNLQGHTSCTHTYKTGQGLVRQEIEYEISMNIYHQLLSNTDLVPLEKIRTTVQHQGREYQIDEYPHLDLRVVEVEFPSVEDAEAFVAPNWFGKELGKEEEYRNKQLWVGLQHPSVANRHLKSN
ncbi:CYTH domain-containing protein [Paenibacillus hexagrammi]|uniref:Adenylate cyclase n=1 Tax=Paenibacillus hexagrammi TaxID=2908839 RepID=A0ABY3SGT2_9BACL|nr:adenylate cyclase [Paenibacillus sp. YPD9-1]UJF32610.1 adenylate cyclase [Paenibacillus sp. YPD9-1]